MDYIEHPRTEDARLEIANPAIPGGSEEFYRGIAEMTTDAIITIDTQSIILFANPAAEKMFGYERGALVGQPLTTLMPEHLRSLHRGAVNRYIATGEKHIEWRRVELNGLNKCGKDIPLEISYSEFVQNGTRTFTGILRDLTERKRVEDELQRRASEFAALYETARDFATPRDLLTSLQTIVERATALLSAPAGGIFLYNAERCALERVVTKGLPGPLKDMRLHLGEGMAGRVAQTRQPLIVDDYQAWEHRAWPYEGIPIRAVVQVPMLYGGELIGVLSVGELGTTTRKFTGEDARLLSLFAAQAASAVYNARLLAETERRAMEFAALYETTYDLAAQQDLPTLLQTIVDRATTLFSVQGAVIYLYDARQSELVIAANKGLQFPLGTRFGLNEGMSGYVARTHQPLVVDDYRTWEHRRRQFDDIPITAAMQVPILYGGELIGVLGVAELGLTSRKFTQDDVRLLSLFAGQAASAVHNARLLQETSARAEQVALLYDAGLALNRVLDTQLEFLLKIATKAVKADCAEFFRYDAATNTLHFELGIGQSPEMQAHSRELGHLPGDERSLVGWVSKHRLLLNLTDVSSEHRWGDLDPGIRSGLWVPVEHEKKLRGVLGVMSKNLNAFTPQAERILVLFANQVAVAMENTRLFYETRRRLAEIEALNEISTALRTAQTVDEMLPAVLDEALAVLNTTAGRIFLYDAAHKELHTVFGRGWFTQIPTNSMSPREDIAGHVFSTGEPYRSREFASDPHTSKAVRPEIPPGWGGACIPIRAADEIVGALLVSVQLPRELTPDEVGLLSTLAEIAGNAIHRARLHQSLEESFIQTILALAEAIDAHDSYTSGHSKRMAEMAVAVAQEMGLSSEEQEALRLAARLHDIGKIGVPDAILNKPGPLNAEEWALIQQHPVIGEQILMPVQRLQKVALIVRHHQEKFDGSGYPDRLAGEAIPLAARILSVVDAYSAMTDDRVYRKGHSPADAQKELKNLAGEKFDPMVVEAFLSVNGKH